MFASNLSETIGLVNLQMEAQVQLDAGNYNLAILACDKAFDIDPMDPICGIIYAACCISTQRASRALSTCTKFIENDDHSAGAYGERAIARLILKPMDFSSYASDMKLALENNYVPHAIRLFVRKRTSIGEMLFLSDPDAVMLAVALNDDQTRMNQLINLGQVASSQRYGHIALAYRINLLLEDNIYNPMVLLELKDLIAKKPEYHFAQFVLARLHFLRKEYQLAIDILSKNTVSCIPGPMKYEMSSLLKEVTLAQREMVTMFFASLAQPEDPQTQRPTIGS